MTQEQYENHRHIHYQYWLADRFVLDEFDPSELKYLSKKELKWTEDTVKWLKELNKKVKYVHTPTFLDYIDGEQHAFSIKRYSEDDLVFGVAGMTEENTMYFYCVMEDKETHEPVYRVLIV